MNILRKLQKATVQYFWAGLALLGLINDFIKCLIKALTALVALRKQAYSNELKILPPKMKIFR